VIVWYCWVAVVDAPSFSLKAWKGVLAVPLLGCWLAAAPKAPVDAPKPPVVLLAGVEEAPNPPPVLPPPNRPLPPVEAPKPLGLFCWPKRPPLLLLAAPNAGAAAAVLFPPKPPLPNAEPVEAPPPKRPPPVVELKGFEPKAVEPVLVPKPPKGMC
jgi:hypothetical protein